MPFDRPTLTDLRTQIANDINGDLSGVDALLRYSNLGIIGAAFAGAANGFYGYLDWIAANSVPFSATGEYLEGWAALKGVTRKPATVAAGVAVFSGTNGATIPAGSAIKRADGVSYTTTAATTVTDGTASAPIIADDAGTAGNAGDGVTMYLGVGVEGVTAQGLASGPITGGADIELDSSLRSRMLAAYAKPPQGGSIDDYGTWALTVPGVTRCWAIPSGMGPGSVVLLFMMDDAQAENGGFPQGTDGCAIYETRDTAAAGDQLTLANAIYFYQPVTALIYAVSPTPNTIDLTIAGLSEVDDGTKAAIAAAVAQTLRVNGSPGGVTNVSAIETAIAAVSGTEGFVLTGIACSAGSVSPGSAGNITSNAGALPVLGDIGYPDAD
jgi:uncharacterized phage protein gp47/JayE